MGNRLAFFILLAMSFMNGGVKAADASPVEHVSLIQLIGNPNQFHTRKILVAGYLQIRFEGNILYLSKEDAQVGNDKNGLWIGYDKQIQSKEDLKDYDAYYNRLMPMSDKYVIVEGVFDKGDTGHLDCCSGSIMAIVRVIPLTTQKNRN